MSSSAMDVSFDTGNSRHERPENRRALFIWVMGAAISLAPLFVISFVNSLNDDAGFSLGTVFSSVFSNKEVLFICVTLLSSAMFEVTSQRKNRYIVFSLLLLSLICFALLYVLISEVTVVNAIIWTIVISLGITLILGTIVFIKRKG